MDLISYIENPERLDKSSRDEMKTIVNKYPYFQTAHMLYLINLKQLNQKEFSSQLNLSSSFIADRKVLFSIFNKNISQTTVSAVEKMADNTKQETLKEQIAPKDIQIDDQKKNGLTDNLLQKIEALKQEKGISVQPKEEHKKDLKDQKETEGTSTSDDQLNATEKLLKLLDEKKQKPADGKKEDSVKKSENIRVAEVIEENKGEIVDIYEQIRAIKEKEETQKKELKQTDKQKKYSEQVTSTEHIEEKKETQQKKEQEDIVAEQFKVKIETEQLKLKEEKEIQQKKEQEDIVAEQIKVKIETEQLKLKEEKETQQIKEQEDLLAEQIKVKKEAEQLKLKEEKEIQQKKEQEDIVAEQIKETKKQEDLEKQKNLRKFDENTFLPETHKTAADMLLERIAAKKAKAKLQKAETTEDTKSKTIENKTAEIKIETVKVTDKTEIHQVTQVVEVTKEQETTQIIQETKEVIHSTPVETIETKTLEINESVPLDVKQEEKSGKSEIESLIVVEKIAESPEVNIVEVNQPAEIETKQEISTIHKEPEILKKETIATTDLKETAAEKLLKRIALHHKTESLKVSQVGEVKKDQETNQIIQKTEVVIPSTLIENIETKTLEINESVPVNEKSEEKLVKSETASLEIKEKTEESKKVIVEEVSPPIEIETKEKIITTLKEPEILKKENASTKDVKETAADKLLKRIASQNKSPKKILEQQETEITLATDNSLPETGNIKSKDEQTSIIDNFIKNLPTLERIKEPTINGNVAESSSEESDTFYTEPMAEIYHKQKNYSKAIQVFEKLILKFPEKSSYFASRIEEIKKLINQQ